MDRNTATGLILMALLIIVYVQFFAPQPTKPEELTEEQPELVEEQEMEEQERELDSLEVEALGEYATAASGEEKSFTLENEDISVTFSNKGAIIEQVVLKNYDSYEGDPIVLIDRAGETFDWFTSYNGQRLNLSQLYFEAEESNIGDTSVVDFTLTTQQGAKITYTYKLPPQGFELYHNLKSDNNALGDLMLNWTDKINRVERDIEVSRINTTITYYTADGNFESLSERSEELEEETIEEAINWVAIKQKFFTAAIISDKPFSQGYVATNVDPSETEVVKTAKVNVMLPATALGNENTFKYYFGPNKFGILQDVAPEFSENLDLGWPPMSWVNRFVLIPLFNLFSQFIDNYGIIIIIMVLIIKLVLFPLSYKSYVSMAKMKVLKPQLDEIRSQYPDDQMKAQQEQMKLYQQVGVNPISGCVPLLLQMPILLAMFYFFPESIELRQESFLWADDLSTYDVLVQWDTYIPILSSIYGNHVSAFVLLMTISTVLITWSNQQVSTAQGPMAAISYMMPIVFMFVLNSYPAALSFYYLVSNLVTFAQQWGIRRFVDDEKILKKLEENKKRAGTKKKSSFQKRLEEAMKASQEAQRKKKK